MVMTNSMGDSGAITIHVRQPWTIFQLTRAAGFNGYLFNIFISFTRQVTPCDKHWNVGCKTAVNVLTIQRNAIEAGSGVSLGNPRKQLNKATGFIDAGFVYGHTSRRSALLRTFSQGKLHADANGVPRNSWGHKMAGHDRVSQSAQRLTGDPRGNENPGLLAITGLWVLEHNRQCDVLLLANPAWDDTRLFSEARKRVIALLQHVTVSEYIPVLIGEVLPPYSGYDPGVTANVYGEFAVAAYRYGKQAGRTLLRPLAAFSFNHCVHSFSLCTLFSCRPQRNQLNVLDH
jgi:hypothetical protein